MISNLPDTTSKFYFVNPGCVQWLVKPDGKVLVPVYIGGPGSAESSVTVLECSFDGSVLSYIGHGDENDYKRMVVVWASLPWLSLKGNTILP